MIVVVASAYDVRALRIVAHWGSQSAAILSAGDLCMPGWALRVPLGPPNTAVIGGRTVPAGEIRGILTLRPCIFPEHRHAFDAQPPRALERSLQLPNAIPTVDLR